VQRCSESVAALASALAKAEAELVNPEKSLTATIRTGASGEGERTFRYAPLSHGLDIVRKTLGQHEIATMQTTVIDQASGLVNLTTVLAHASGEWIASDWPVCPITDIASPHRMGAALTYARRYALFTLVGIAGEDDIDAPDFACGPTPRSGVKDGQDPSSPRESRNGRLRGDTRNKPAEMLDADQLAALRNNLVTEVATLASAEAAASWASRVLPLKNSLTAADAKLVEETFEQKLLDFSSPNSGENSIVGIATVGEITPAARPHTSSGIGDQQSAGEQSAKIDKSVLTVAAPRRYRNREHLRYVAQQACLICGRKPSDPHHLRYMQPRALGRKASDEYAVPLCRSHHRAVHRAGDEGAWWRTAGIEPLKIARKLWKHTRMSEGRILPEHMAENTDRDRAVKGPDSGGELPA
jgi:ERF superfamily protein